MHIKLDLLKNFVIAIDQNANGCGFRYLQQKFTAKSEANLTLVYLSDQKFEN